MKFHKTVNDAKDRRADRRLLTASVPRQDSPFSTPRHDGTDSPFCTPRHDGTPPSTVRDSDGEPQDNDKKKKKNKISLAYRSPRLACSRGDADEGLQEETPRSEGGEESSTHAYSHIPCAAAATLESEGSLKDHSEETTDRTKEKVLTLAVVVWMAAGLSFFVSEGYAFVDALYNLVQILTTVGYGDIVPETRVQKIVTAFFVLSSTLLMAGVISEVIDMVLDHQAEMLKASMEAKEEQIKSGLNSQTLRKASEGPTDLQRTQKQLLIHSLTFMAFVSAGTVFYWIVEACSCSYGRTEIEGCDPKNCEATGGEVKSFVDAFYMSVVTMTTVGYGDEVALSWYGRLFGAFWMLFGVGTLVNLVGAVTEFFKVWSEGSNRARVTEEMFHQMDADGNGQLDRSEFLRLQLVLLRFATQDDLDHIDRQFSLIDASGDGSISVEEFRGYYL